MSHDKTYFGMTEEEIDDCYEAIIEENKLKEAGLRALLVGTEIKFKSLNNKDKQIIIDNVEDQIHNLLRSKHNITSEQTYNLLTDENSKHSLLYISSEISFELDLTQNFVKNRFDILHDRIRQMIKHDEDLKQIIKEKFEKMR